MTNGKLALTENDCYDLVTNYCINAEFRELCECIALPSRIAVLLFIAAENAADTRILIILRSHKCLAMRKIIDALFR